MSVSNQQPNQREQESQEHVVTNEKQPSGSISELESLSPSSSDLKQEPTTESSTESPKKSEETNHTTSESTSASVPHRTLSSTQTLPTNLKPSFRIILAAILIVLTVVTIKAGSILNRFLGLPLQTQIALSIIQAELSIVTILSAFPPVSNWFSQLWQSLKPILKLAISFFSLIILLLMPVLGTWLIVQYESKQPHNTTKTVSTHIPTTSTTTPNAQGTSFAVSTSTSKTGTKIPVNVTPSMTGSATPGPDPTPSVATTSPLNCGSASFTMFGFDLQHTHYNPNETCLSTSKVSSGLTSWHLPIGNGAISASPLVENGIVYVGSPDGNLYAYNTATNALHSYHTQGTFIDGSPTIDVTSGTLYLAPEGSTLYALDASTLALKWTGSVGSITYSSPLVANGMVYLGGGDGYLYIFNASGCSSQPCQPTQKVNLNARIDSSPTFYNNVLYVSTLNQTGPNFYAIDVSNYQISWSATLSGGTQSTPAVDTRTGMVYVGAGNYLYAFNVSGCGSSTCSGTQSSLFGTGINSSPAVDSGNGVVYIGSTNGKLYAFDASTLRQLRSCQAGTDIDYTSPSIANGVIYVGSDDDTLYAFDATASTCSSPLWLYKTGGAINSSPAVVNGVIYIGSQDGNLYAFQLPAATA